MLKFFKREGAEGVAYSRKCVVMRYNMASEFIRRTFRDGISL